MSMINVEHGSFELCSIHNLEVFAVDLEFLDKLLSWQWLLNRNILEVVVPAA